MAGWCFPLHLNSSVYPVPSRTSLQNAASVKGVPPFEKNFLDDSCSQTLRLELSGTPFPDSVSACIQHIVHTDRNKQRAQCNWLTGQNGPCIQVVQWERRTERWERGCAKVRACFTPTSLHLCVNLCRRRSSTLHFALKDILIDYYLNRKVWLSGTWGAMWMKRFYASMVPVVKNWFVETQSNVILVPSILRHVDCSVYPRWRITTHANGGQNWFSAYATFDGSWT